MAPKLEIPGITFAYLLQELKELENSLVTKVQELKNNWIRLRLLTKSGQKDLVFTENAFFVSQYALHAKQQSSGFGGFLNKHLKMKRLQAIKQLNFERIFFFDFGSVILVAELFAKGNLILLDSERKIMMPRRAERWSARELKRGVGYKQPPAMPNIAELSFEEFQKLMDVDKKVVPALVRNVGIAPVLAEEACFVAEVEKEAKAGSIAKRKLEKLYNILKGFYINLDLSREQAVLIEHKGSLCLLPFRLKAFENSVVQEFKSINEALNELLVSQAVSSERDTIETKVSELMHALQKQKESLKRHKTLAEEFKRKAERICEHFADVSSAFEFAKREFEQKKGKGVVMYNKSFGSIMLKSIDFKKGKIKIELKEEPK
ncbi:MAG: NFACT family protein [Candidatus Diapherotrites archaeon]|nr:NFACT family protein [Candidatus Diapherotrites archaeon]